MAAVRGGARNGRGRTRPLLTFLGHHKAGTRWVGRILEQLAETAGLKWECTSNPKWFGYDLQRFVDEREIDILSYTNAEQRYVDQLRSFRGFHVIRDPRDVVVSAYFSHLKSHGTRYWPELVEHRRRLAALPQREGLLLDIDFTTRLPTDGYDLRPFDALRTWDFSQEDTLEMRFETLIADPVEALAAAIRFAGLTTPRETLERIVAANSFQVLSGGRSPGREDNGSHYRSGTPGGWRRYLEPVHLAALAERTGDVVATLGYGAPATPRQRAG